MALSTETSSFEKVPESKHFASAYTRDSDSESEGCRPPTIHTMDDPPQHAPRRPLRRKEIEARRFNGKENVSEYLLQFEVTARRNLWDEAEKATALLCALDGPARGILAEFDDPATVTYQQVKASLTRRFGPTQLVEVHEQALTQLRLRKGQNIRELAQEVQRLVKQAYPDIIGPARDRFTVKHLLATLHDKEAIFYIREKNPQDVTEACKLYERYMALTGEDHQGRRGHVKGVSDSRPESSQPMIDSGALQKQVTQAIERMSQATQQQIQKLADAVAQLKPPTAQVPATTGAPPNTQPRPADVRQPLPPNVPRKPCPRCGQSGHWARDCTRPSNPPNTENCFRCGRPGHRQRECHLNGARPVLAPDAGNRYQNPQ